MHDSFLNLDCFIVGNTQLEMCLLEQQVIKTYDPIKLKEFIGRFSSLTGVRPIMNIYNKVTSLRISLNQIFGVGFKKYIT